MKSVYFDTSIFVEIGSRKSKHAASIRQLLASLKEDKTRIYTSIITVEELSVSTCRKGAPAKDVYSDINKLARVFGIPRHSLDAGALQNLSATRSGLWRLPLPGVHDYGRCPRRRSGLPPVTASCRGRTIGGGARRQRLQLP